jgi:hypothetical protein
MAYAKPILGECGSLAVCDRSVLEVGLFFRVWQLLVSMRGCAQWSGDTSGEGESAGLDVDTLVIFQIQDI